MVVRRSKRRRRWRWTWRPLRVAAAVLGGVVAATVLLILPWRWIAPPVTAVIVLDRLASDEPVHYRWVAWDDIASTVPIAAVAAEDQKFPDHHGFDWEAIGDALDRNRAGGRVRGGSTISQQVAKNLYLWKTQSWVRKGLEAYLTVWVEALWPKRRILEVYLNVAEFGPGVYGVGAASERLLRKTPAELSSADAALLVAVLPSPRRMFVASPSEYVQGRVRQIQAAVRQLGGERYLAGL